MNTKRIRGMFLDNFLIKLFALLFAIVLWLHASTRGRSEVNFVIPLELRNIPASVAIIGDVPDFVEVRLSGDESKLRDLSSDDVKVSLNLSEAKEGDMRYTITDSDIKAPAGLNVVKISPVVIGIRFDAKIKKQLDVKPMLVGEPATGYVVSGVRVIPDSVVASGPKSELEWLESVSTEPIGIQGLKGGLENRVAIQKPESGYIRLDDNHVVVMVSVSQEEDDKPK